MTLTVALEVSPEAGPAAGRGIGRYVSALRAANRAIGCDLVEIDAATGSGRWAELVALDKRRRLLRGVQADVFHAPTAYTSVIPRPDMATVTSVLDLIPLMVDGYTRTGFKARLFHRIAAGADVIMTLSMHAAREISSRLEVAGDRVVVAPLPPAEAFTPDGEKAGIKAPYVAAMIDLAVKDARKRAHWLGPIARELDRAGVGLLVCGQGTEALSTGRLQGLGRVSDEHWARVLRGASAMVYTSAYEGQGMPPLEAISCGTPVVAMSNTAIPEVVGLAGRLVAEEATDEAGQRSLAVALMEVVSDSAVQRQLRENCRAQASTYSPTRFATQVRASYEQALAARARA